MGKTAKGPCKKDYLSREEEKKNEQRRLTYKNRNGLYVLRKGGSPENVREAIAHLAAYEDSGLTPNEVQIFGKAHNAFLDAFCDFAESSANEHFEKQIKRRTCLLSTRNKENTG